MECSSWQFLTDQAHVLNKPKASVRQCTLRRFLPSFIINTHRFSITPASVSVTKDRVDLTNTRQRYYSAWTKIQWFHQICNLTASQSLTASHVSYWLSLELHDSTRTYAMLVKVEQLKIEPNFSLPKERCAEDNARYAYDGRPDVI